MNARLVTAAGRSRSPLLGALASFILTTVAMDTLPDTVFVGVSALRRVRVRRCDGRLAGLRQCARRETTLGACLRLAAGAGVLGRAAARALSARNRRSLRRRHALLHHDAAGASRGRRRLPRRARAPGAHRYRRRGLLGGGSGGAARELGVPELVLAVREVPDARGAHAARRRAVRCGGSRARRGARRLGPRDVSHLALGAAAVLGVLASLPGLPGALSAGSAWRPSCTSGWPSLLFAVCWIWTVGPGGLGARVGCAAAGAAPAMTRSPVYERRPPSTACVPSRCGACSRARRSRDRRGRAVARCRSRRDLVAANRGPSTAAALWVAARRRRARAGLARDARARCAGGGRTSASRSAPRGRCSASSRPRMDARGGRAAGADGRARGAHEGRPRVRGCRRQRRCWRAPSRCRFWRRRRCTPGTVDSRRGPADIRHGVCSFVGVSHRRPVRVGAMALAVAVGRLAGIRGRREAPVEARKGRRLFMRYARTLRLAGARARPGRRGRLGDGLSAQGRGQVGHAHGVHRGRSHLGRHQDHQGAGRQGRCLQRADRHRDLRQALQLPTLYAEAQTALAAGNTKLAATKLDAGAGARPDVPKAKEQADAIEKGGKPAPDTSPAPSADATATATGHAPKPGESDRNGRRSSKWTPDTITGFTPPSSSSDPLTVSREYVPSGKSPARSVIVAEQFRTAADAKGRSSAGQGALPQERGRHQGQGPRRVLRYRRQALRGIGFTDGAVMVALELTAAKSPQDLRSLAEQIAAQLP